MICWRCNTSNPDTSVYCERCGSVLLRRPVVRKKKVSWQIILACVAVLIVCGYIGYKSLVKPRPAEVRSGQTRIEEGAPNILSRQGAPTLTAGEIFVRGKMGEDISRMPAAVMAGGWVAVPVWALLGGESINVRGVDANEIRIERGFWAEGSPVGLWQAEAGQEMEAPGLSSWAQRLPLAWEPLSTDGLPIEVEITAPQKRGSVIVFTLPAEIREAGVFRQESGIVGWTFGGWTERGYLWAGPAGSDLVATTRVGPFCNSVLSRYREAYFEQALSMENETAENRLRALAQGFRLPSLLEGADIPPELRPQSVLLEMHSLALELIQQGSAKEVARILDNQVLLEAGDPTLVTDAVQAVVKDQDYNRAIQYLERVKKKNLEKTGRRLSGLDQFEAQLYKDWLREIIVKGGYFSGMAAFEEAQRAFPDDLEIHLLGVQAALAENNRERARELLESQSYPPPFDERAKELAKRIKELEDQEAVAVRFNTGDESIRVAAYLNGTYYQNFVVDTGTSMTTIPSSAVEALKIRIDESTPVRAVLTASGMGVTYEVTLESIELEGLKVSNMRVLIIDLPGVPDYGLLGLDFLNNFRFEIDKRQGVLRLRKREPS